MTGVGFQPDFLWIKGRNEGTDHELQDSVRGSTKYLNSNDDGVEATETEGVKSFDSDGYTLGNANYWNWTAKTFVGWSWKAGTTTGLSGGTITPSSYSINTTAGFGIYKWTGTGSAGTIAHGLGVVPKMIIVKSLGVGADWGVYNEAIGNTNTLFLNLTNAETARTYWNSTSPTSTVFSVKDEGVVNATGSDYIAYVFTPIKGYSAFGSYVGTGNADGPFIYTGFRPAFTICKISSGNTNNWKMVDDKRPGYNINNKTINADSSAVESTEDNCDYTANGFKIRRNGNDVNGSGYEYVYMAFAEFPFVSSNSKPGVAR
jgi:hypothetical protein